MKILAKVYVKTQTKGATDGSCKVWSAMTGFCIVTFKNHTAPVTGVSWLRSGAAFASCAKDGTVRVYDLRRYRNFRTLTTPRSQRLAACTTDAGGELVAAAGGDSGSIFVWSIRTGRLLDEFANHESACVRVAFSPIVWVQNFESDKASCEINKKTAVLKLFLN